MAFIDTHAHLDCEEFKEDIDEVIQRCKDNDLKIIINNGLNPASNRATVELSKKYPIIKRALGLYPLDAIKLSDEEIETEINFIRQQDPIAIGEIGLDYHWDKENHERQKYIFIKMLKLSKELNIPAIIHSRDAEEDVINILEKERIRKVVIHCFNGNEDLIKKAESLGYYFSIPCIITFVKHFQDMVKTININKILTETDCPLLSPFRGKRNEPINVRETIKKIADIKGFEPKEVENNILLNYKRLFE